MHDYDLLIRLPRHLVRAVESFLVEPVEAETSTDRVAAYQLLVDELLNLIGSPKNSAEAWVNAHTGKAFTVRLTERGEWIPLDDQASPSPHPNDVSIPIDLVRMTFEATIQRGGTDWDEAAIALGTLIGEWNALFVDEEKLHGHLVRRHSNTPPLPARAGMRRLLRIHRDFHLAGFGNWIRS